MVGVQLLVVIAQLVPVQVPFLFYDFYLPQLLVSSCLVYKERGCFCL